MAEQTEGKRRTDRRLILLVAAVALGIVFLIVGGLGSSKSEATQAEAGELPDPAVYAAEVEEQIVSLCARVKGAGQVTAVVTLDGGYRAVYATDVQSTSGGYKSSTVLVGSGSSESPLLLGYENPRISGIGVVCAGAEDPQVRQSLLALISAAFDVGTNKIYVATGRVS